MSLTDARRFYVLMRDAGATGVHSHDIRRLGCSGNPSQRAKDIVDHGVDVSTRREAVGRRPGSRYWLAEHAPDDAVAVRPNGVEIGGGRFGGGPPEAGSDAYGAASSAADLSAAYSWVWDGFWDLVPVEELALP